MLYSSCTHIAAVGVKGLKEKKEQQQLEDATNIVESGDDQ